MRLLVAELRKLRRPLTVWTVLAIVVLIGLGAWGGQKSASQSARFLTQSGFVGPTCADLNMQPGPACDAAVARITRQNERMRKAALGSITSDLREAASVRSPLGAGAMAAGMMASLFGVIALLLMAGGHVGQEWSGRTIKQVLTQEGRRWRVLAAKFASLVVAGVTMLAVLWVALALLGFVFDAAYPLPVHASAGSALASSLNQTARALLVIAAFAALGTLSAMVTRNTLGGFFLGFAVIIGSFILAGFKAVGKFTPTYWVAGWMRFRTTGDVPTFAWRDSFYPLRFPTVTAGLIGLCAFIAICGALAWARFERSDIKV